MTHQKQFYVLWSTENTEFGCWTSFNSFKLDLIQLWPVAGLTLLKCIFAFYKNSILTHDWRKFIWIKLAAKHFEIILNLLLFCGAPSPPWVCWGLKLKWEAIWLNIWTRIIFWSGSRRDKNNVCNIQNRPMIFDNPGPLFFVSFSAMSKVPK